MGNDFCCDPKEIGMLKKLEILDLRNNKINKKNIKLVKQLLNKKAKIEHD